MHHATRIARVMLSSCSAVRKLTEAGDEPACKISAVVDIMLECLLTKSTSTLERAALEGIGYCAIIRSLQKVCVWCGSR